jgi:hypothetical protein
MAAGMHDARILGCEGYAVFFINRQRVHVRPQDNGFSGAAVDSGRHSGPIDMITGFQSEPPEIVMRQTRGFEFRSRKFRVRVDGAPDRDSLGIEFIDKPQ